MRHQGNTNTKIRQDEDRDKTRPSLFLFPSLCVLFPSLCLCLPLSDFEKRNVCLFLSVCCLSVSFFGLRLFVCLSPSISNSEFRFEQLDNTRQTRQRQDWTRQQHYRKTRPDTCLTFSISSFSLCCGCVAGVFCPLLCSLVFSLCLHSSSVSSLLFPLLLLLKGYHQACPRHLSEVAI
jgi:hypothetical protein